MIDQLKKKVPILAFVVNLNFKYLNSFLVILDFVIIIVNFIYSECTIAKSFITDSIYYS